MNNNAIFSLLQYTLREVSASGTTNSRARNQVSLTCVRLNFELRYYRRLWKFYSRKCEVSFAVTVPLDAVTVSLGYSDIRYRDTVRHFSEFPIAFLIVKLIGYSNTVSTIFLSYSDTFLNSQRCHCCIKYVLYPVCRSVQQCMSCWT